MNPVRAGTLVRKDTGHPADALRTDRIDGVRAFPLNDEIGQLVNARPLIPLAQPEDLGNGAAPRSRVDQGQKLTDQLLAKEVVLTPGPDGAVRFTSRTLFTFVMLVMLVTFVTWVTLTLRT